MRQSIKQALREVRSGFTILVSVFVVDGVSSMVVPRRRPWFATWADESNCECLIHGVATDHDEPYTLRYWFQPLKQQAVRTFHGDKYGPKERYDLSGVPNPIQFPLGFHSQLYGKSDAERHPFDIKEAIDMSSKK